MAMTPLDVIRAGFARKDVPLPAKYLAVMAAALLNDGQPGFKKAYAEVGPEVRSYIRRLMMLMKKVETFDFPIFNATYHKWFTEVAFDSVQRYQT